MKIAPVLTVVAALMLSPAPSAAQTPPVAETPVPAPAGEAFQVVRRGDSDMTCDALIAEINNLNGQVQALQTEMMAAGNAMSSDAMASLGAGRGGAVSAGLGLANMAGGFIPGLGVLTGAATAVRQQAAQAAMARNHQEIVGRSASLGEKAMAMAPMAERAQHLSEIMRGKGC